MGNSQTNPMGADPRFRQMGISPQPPQFSDPRFRQMSGPPQFGQQQPPQFGQQQPPQVQAQARQANPLNAFPTMARPPQSNGMQMGRNGPVLPQPFVQNPFPDGRGPYADGDVVAQPFTGRPNPFPNGRGPFLRGRR